MMAKKTFVACVFSACVLPLAPALAQNNAEPSGPQGTGWYGAPNAALPVPQTVAPAYVYAGPQLVAPLAQESVNAGASAPGLAYEREARRTDARMPVRERWVYNGFSADTNPPVPPQ